MMDKIKKVNSNAIKDPPLSLSLPPLSLLLLLPKAGVTSTNNFLLFSSKEETTSK